ncbi:uncharacterized protein LOC127157946 [Labeo rohita]|uniref:uncharacterized protein LOC127157946 n=1 Tax=Labeo rohita TaxID=84645 RepID=UPI0021E1CC41|nr:uncharacterized protein LOC127157946 [Labeo rohita]
MIHQTNFFREEKVQKYNIKCWDRRTNKVNLTDCTGPLAESDCTVGRHTEHLHLTGRVFQGILGPPVPGTSGGKIMIKKLLLRLKRLLEPRPRPWISRDENDNIKIIDLSERETSVKIIIERFFSYYFYYYFFPQYSSFSKNQNISSKISEFIKYFELDKNQLIRSQSGFAVTECETGPPVLIGPFKPENVSNTKLPDIIHSEDQCIGHIEETIKGKEHTIKAIYIFTKYSPCLGRKDHDPCMIQLARFSEKMFYHHKIKVYVFFQDIYGLSGNLVNELRKLSREQDPLIKNPLLQLKEMINKQQRRSKFKYSKEDQDEKLQIKNSSMIKKYITTEIKKITDEKSWKFISSLHQVKIEFPSDEMTLDEFENFGKEQAEKIKIQLKQLNVSEEISEIICSLFHSKWCDLINDRHEEFIYERLSECINTFAVHFAVQDIKAVTKHFNLIRINLE